MAKIKQSGTEAAAEVAEEIVALERSAWDALSTSGDAAAGFYERVLASEVFVVIPGGVLIENRSRVIDSMRGEPWGAYEISNERVLRLGEDAAVLVYEATARRGDFTYEALFNSTYRREAGEWRLALHQQTPK